MIVKTKRHAEVLVDVIDVVESSNLPNFRQRNA
jgi:hypothetical protein